MRHLLQKAGLALLVTTAVAVGGVVTFACSYRTNGTGVIDNGEGGNILGFPTNTSTATAPGGTTSSSGSSGGGTPGCPETSVQAPPTFQVPIQQLFSCTATDFSTLTADLNNNTSVTDLYNALSSNCRSCVFSSQQDSHWQPLVWSPDMASGTAFANYGSCFYVNSMDTYGCGQGEQDLQWCFSAACPSSCSDHNGCLSAAQSGVCSNYSNEAIGGCGTKLTGLLSSCGTLRQVVSVVCGNGTGSD
jgi:hypothetical protein